MIGLVVSDVDGTLIKPGESGINEDIIRLIGEMKDRDVLFAVASGRDYNSLRTLFSNVKNEIIYIASNGGVVIYQGKVLCKTPLERMLSVSIITELEKRHDCRLLVAGESTAYVSTHDTDFINHLKSRGFNVENVKDFKAIREPFTKISVYGKNGMTEELFDFMEAKWGMKATVVRSGNNWADITSEYVNKGNALAVVQQIFEVSQEDTVTFGDNYNDIEMFERSFYSYAMQHSESDIRRAAKHIAPSIETILEDIVRM